MTIIDTTLYANGALRLSRHGAGKGGNVLVHVPDGRQLEISDSRLAEAISRISSLEHLDQSPLDIMEDIRIMCTSRSPGWYHN